LNDNWVRLGDVIKKILEEYIKDDPKRPVFEQSKADIPVEMEMQGDGG